MKSFVTPSQGLSDSPRLPQVLRDSLRPSQIHSDSARLSQMFSNFLRIRLPHSVPGSLNVLDFLSLLRFSLPLRHPTSIPDFLRLPQDIADTLRLSRSLCNSVELSQALSSSLKLSLSLWGVCIYIYICSHLWTGIHVLYHLEVLGSGGPLLSL